MKNYIDGFVFPLPKIHLNAYKTVVEQVAAIWEESLENVCEIAFIRKLKPVKNQTNDRF